MSTPTTQSYPNPIHLKKKNNNHPISSQAKQKQHQITWHHLQPQRPYHLDPRLSSVYQRKQPKPRRRLDRSKISQIGGIDHFLFTDPHGNILAFLADSYRFFCDGRPRRMGVNKKNR